MSLQIEFWKFAKHFFLNIWVNIQDSGSLDIDGQRLTIWILIIHYWQPTFDCQLLMTTCWWIWTVKSWQSKSWWCGYWWCNFVGKLLTDYCWPSTVNYQILTDLNVEKHHRWNLDLCRCARTERGKVLTEHKLRIL